MMRTSIGIKETEHKSNFATLMDALVLLWKHSLQISQTDLVGGRDWALLNAFKPLALGSGYEVSVSMVPKAHTSLTAWHLQPDGRPELRECQCHMLQNSGSRQGASHRCALNLLSCYSSEACLGPRWQAMCRTAARGLRERHSCGV